MEYEKAEQGRKFAQIDTLRLSFERKEMELMKKQRRIDEGNNLLKNAKSQLRKKNYFSIFCFISLYFVT